MCRSAFEGGRRCPHDGSDARQARRMNAGLREGFSDSVVARSGNTAEPTANGGTISVAQAKARVEETKDLFKMVLTGNPAWNGEIDGVKHDKPLDFLRARLETQIRELGAATVADAESRTGITFDSIREYQETQRQAILTEGEELAKDEDELKADLKAHYAAEGVTFLLGDKIRLAHRDNPDDETITALYNRIVDIDERKDALRKNVFNFEVNYDDKIVADYSANRDAIIEVLGEHRELGGKLKLDATSDKIKGELLKDAVQILPKDWIEASNANTSDLRVKKTKARAHYTRSAGQKTYEVVNDYTLVEKDADWEPRGTHHESGWVKLEADEDGMVVAEHDGIKVDSYVGAGSALWIAPKWEYPTAWSSREDGSKPHGRGWVKATIKTTDITYDDNNSRIETIRDMEVWRRPIKSRQLRSVEMKAELLVDGQRDPFNKDKHGYSTALHEFSHRVEDSDVAFMSIVQDEFYRRRTEVDGVPMPKIRLYRGKQEFAIPDDFASDYMGKRYPDGRHFEILSTGMEAIFSGEFGGMIGLRGKKPDLDMRNFIVGVLAGI